MSNSQDPDRRKSAIMKLISCVPIFQGIPPELLQNMLGTMKKVEVPANQCVIRCGEADRDFFIVISGTFSVSREEEGREIVFASPGPGDTIGEMSFIDGMPRSADVVATTDAVLLSVSRTLLMKIPEAARMITANVSAVLARNIRRINEHVPCRCVRPDKPGM